MAQIQLSAEEARQLCMALYSWGGMLDELKGKDLKAEARLTCNAQQAFALAQKIEALSFDTRACVVCGTSFELANPRKQTCSDRCRQQLSRKKRDERAWEASARRQELENSRKLVFKNTGGTPTEAQRRKQQRELAAEHARHMRERAAVGPRRIGELHQVSQTDRDIPPSEPKPPTPSAAPKPSVQKETEAPTPSNDVAENRKKLAKRATPAILKKLEKSFNSEAFSWRGAKNQPPFYDPQIYLMDTVEDFGIKRRKKLTKAFWKELHKLVPEAVDFEPPEWSESRRCLYWGFVLRLGNDEEIQNNKDYRNSLKDFPS
ncbi:hypothetical protein KR100_00230 [Synechococcus sp. KORDI-100]|uniref:DUF2116 family Zn-ribbon domain-containing protein n=1 Tax=Synechococcus sp. KORDI-100 TaxID=1280380 RepID=UPI0004E03DAC|nr:DUF2116 family Zn-ribbon domain-containing protein [Synechococcus sp. KORDI-100]AII41836.1 hypothetical protein KR100_00230 [Synechococcus sp. KORDI-100]